MQKNIIFLFLSSLLFLPLSGQVNINDEKISLEEIWLSPAFFPEFAGEFRWMNDDHYYGVLENGKIQKYHVEDKSNKTVLLDLSELELQGLSASEIESYEFSSDEQKVLLIANSQPIYRNSSLETVMVVDLETKKVSLLNGGDPVSNATFSPDGSKVGYVSENNLFYFDNQQNKDIQITVDGKRNEIINGATDWVYEEEFAYTKAFFWSPDNEKIGFIRFDEREVREFSMPIYGDLYPDPYTFKYPKAGEKNSSLSVYIYHLSNQKIIQADIGDEEDIYLARMKWANNDKLAAMRLNRLQNQLDILMLNAADGKQSIFLTEKSETYIREATDDKWHFLKNGEGMLYLSEQDGYQHIYHYDMAGQLISQLTQGDFEVAEIVGVDEANGKIYYLSTEVSPLERHLYSINLKGKKKKKLSEAEGTHSVTVSSGFNYYVDDYSSETKPGVTALCDAKGKVLETLVNNEKLEKRVSKLDIKAPEFFDFQTNAGVKLNGWMIKPANFDASEKYPVLMFVYGGPGSQEVLKQWGMFNYLWYQMLAQQGYIIACVDNRGTGGRGRDFRAVTYAELGKYETEDQIEAAKYLQSLPYIDNSRIGIWGWSYGGYMTALCMTKGNGLFKAGISVAPVSNWRFYDTIYTERYLKTPQLNPKGYDQNSPINFVSGLKGNLLLVHGTGDDNVHFQNSMELVNALVNANKQFDVFFYPNRNHGIYGGYTRYHLYKKMTDFLLENL